MPSGSNKAITQAQFLPLSSLSYWQTPKPQNNFLAEPSMFSLLFSTASERLPYVLSILKRKPPVTDVSSSVTNEAQNWFSQRSEPILTSIIFLLWQHLLPNAFAWSYRSLQSSAKMKSKFISFFDLPFLSQYQTTVAQPPPSGILAQQCLKKRSPAVLTYSFIDSRTQDHDLSLSWYFTDCISRVFSSFSAAFSLKQSQQTTLTSSSSFSVWKPRSMMLILLSESQSRPSAIFIIHSQSVFSSSITSILSSPNFSPPFVASTVSSCSPISSKIMSWSRLSLTQVSQTS